MLLESNLPGLELIRRGKVRDVYSVDADHLLIVATDRISAFDVILGSPIPDKGRVLTQISLFWFNFLFFSFLNFIIIYCFFISIAHIMTETDCFV